MSNAAPKLVKTYITPPPASIGYIVCKCIMNRRKFVSPGGWVGLKSRMAGIQIQIPFLEWIFCSMLWTRYVVKKHLPLLP